MRARLLTLPFVALLTVAASSRSTGEFRAPKSAQVTGACAGGSNAKITPASLHLTMSDSAVWTSNSPKATSWTITPKDSRDWPFAGKSFTGTPESPATSGLPRGGTARSAPYEYNVTVHCQDGSTEVIDPDIIVGGTD